MKKQATMSDTYKIVQIITRRGNGPGLISEWFAGMKQWAEANSGPDASALRIWLDIARPRPFYTAEELSRFWPALRLTLGFTKRLEPPPGANRLENELEFWGLPFVRRSDGVCLKIDGKKYFIVEETHRWSERRFNEAEFGAILMEAGT